MKGNMIKGLYTLGSKYDDGHILSAVDIHDNVYRISTHELLKLVHNCDANFSETKKRVYIHLTLKENT